MENNFCIYLHRNILNGKCYVGQTMLGIKNRSRSNGSGYKKQIVFSGAIKKYGWENFEHIILEKGLTKEQANEAEKKYILLYDSFKNGYNMTIGGDGGGFEGHHHTKESREKSSDSHKGEKNSFFGKKHTQEVKTILSLLASQRTHTLNEEQKNQIRKRQMGHIVSEETRNKIRLKKVGVKLKKETKEKISLTMKNKVKNRMRDEKGHFIKEVKNG